MQHVGNNMKELITYILILFSICGYGQFENHNFELDTLVYFYTLNSDTIKGNYVDNDTATGYVKQFRKLIYKRKALRPLIPFDSIQFDYDVQIDRMYFGQLHNGKKVGKWTKWNFGGTSYCWEQLICEDYLFYYKEDTVIFENGFRWPFNKKITYVNDSSEVYGQTSTNSDYLIKFRCLNKSNCKYWLTDPKQIIDSSDYSELDIKLTQFEIGEYDRKIRKILNEKFKNLR